VDKSSGGCSIGGGSNGLGVRVCASTKTTGAIVSAASNANIPFVMTLSSFPVCPYQDAYQPTYA
jgi:hypothetical protein